MRIIQPICEHQPTMNPAIEDAFLGHEVCISPPAFIVCNSHNSIAQLKFLKELILTLHPKVFISEYEVEARTAEQEHDYNFFYNEYAPNHCPFLMTLFDSVQGRAIKYYSEYINNITSVEHRGMQSVDLNASIKKCDEYSGLVPKLLSYVLSGRPFQQVEATDRAEQNTSLGVLNDSTFLGLELILF